MTEDIETRRKRLLHRSRYRGFKEADLLIGGFADVALSSMTADEMDEFEALIAHNDHDIFNWVQDKAPPPAEVTGPVFLRLRQFNIAKLIRGE
ncbi:MAG: succinate dehydrogenase assembly factor 2 [Parvularculaceae bacterium]|nr:succinate dehydrogenase assembly factor 2 [Parvularculaceae bacterium]